MMHSLILFSLITFVFTVSFLVFVNLFITLRKIFKLREFIELDMAFAFLITLIITVYFQNLNSKREQSFHTEKINSVEKIILEKEVPFKIIKEDIFEINILKNGEPSELKVSLENGCTYEIFHNIKIFEGEPFFERKMLKYGVCQFGKELILN